MLDIKATLRFPVSQCDATPPAPSRNATITHATLSPPALITSSIARSPQFANCYSSKL
ncbi:hypothetical protein BJV77DRAFT_995957 [Russula vinacea]|nr:hypothetical protein BJV77DRAFT_995957 [Russula vinacea]